MMTENEARAVAIKETDYCYVLACAWHGEERNSVCLERIFVRGATEEIRLAWWKDGHMGIRPADIEAIDWVALYTLALRANVFNDSEQLGMLRALLK